MDLKLRDEIISTLRHYRSSGYTPIGDRVNSVLASWAEAGRKVGYAADAVADTARSHRKVTE